MGFFLYIFEKYYLVRYIGKPVIKDTLTRWHLFLPASNRTDVFFSASVNDRGTLINQPCVFNVHRLDRAYLFWSSVIFRVLQLILFLLDQAPCLLSAHCRFE